MEEDIGQVPGYEQVYQGNLTQSEMHIAMLSDQENRIKQEIREEQRRMEEGIMGVEERSDDLSDGAQPAERIVLQVPRQQAPHIPRIHNIGQANAQTYNFSPRSPKSFKNATINVGSYIQP